jgi:hypothetical protein
MKKSIQTFWFVFLLFMGMSSSATDGMTEIINELKYKQVNAPVNALQTKKPEPTTARSDSVILMLFATGLIGLTGVSRRKNA